MHPPTHHRLVVGDARDLPGIADANVHLVVTSPPYPMIGMWDEVFCALSPAAAMALKKEQGFAAFDAMHLELDRVWRECARVLVPGGFACINVGDATRSVDAEFCLYPNAARVIAGMRAAGFTPLPDILWRKPTNAPNKFMGSGMLPAGAYVTYEHEYILVFRKGGKRIFRTAEEKAARFRSAFFWEERNAWFSDVWTDLRGTHQRVDRARERSGAFPFELPYRLIQMYTLQGDVVLDPFAGTGTTLLAAAASARNSVGVEREEALAEVVDRSLSEVVEVGNARIDLRLSAHKAFVAARQAEGRPPGHENGPYGFPVVTGQEKELEMARPMGVTPLQVGTWEVRYGLHAPGTQATLFG